MKREWLIVAVVCATGCLGPRHSDYVLEEMPPEYFTGLPDVPVPSSPYSDAQQSQWFAIGYREGFRNGMAPGINVTPRYPLHPPCQANRLLLSAQTNGFERGNTAGFAVSQAEPDRAFGEPKKIDADSDGDGMPDWWEQQYFGSVTGAVATADEDSDTWSNLQEYMRGGNPKKAWVPDTGDVLRLRLFTPVRR